MTSYSGQVCIAGPLACALAAWLVAAPALAQSHEQAPLGSVADPGAGQTPAPPIAPAPNPQIKPAYWASNLGFTSDTHNTGYGYAGPSYVHPFRPHLAAVAGANVNYLYYGYQNGFGGRTNVHSPGLNVEGGLRLAGSNWAQLTLGPGFKNRNIKVEDGTGLAMSTEHHVTAGMNYNAMVYLNPTRRNNVFGMYHYGEEDLYTWSSLAFKQQVSNYGWQGNFTHYLGVQGIAEGNKDIHSRSAGLTLEFLHVPTSMSITGTLGWKHSWSQFGPAQNGPWFGIGIWRRMN